jgi:hypothetical protein
MPWGSATAELALLVRSALPGDGLVPDTPCVPDSVTVPEEISRAMRMLNAGIPLSLLIDLCTPIGIDSRSIISAEQREATSPS